MNTTSVRNEALSKLRSAREEVFSEGEYTIYQCGPCYCGDTKDTDYTIHYHTHPNHVIIRVSSDGPERSIDCMTYRCDQCKKIWIFYSEYREYEGGWRVYGVFN